MPTHQTAACWLVLTGNGRYAYTTNAGSGSVSGYAVDPEGGLTLLDEDGVTGATGANSGPIDAALSSNGRYLYVVNGRLDEIDAFRVGADGSLAPVDTIGGLAPSALGLAAY